MDAYKCAYRDPKSPLTPLAPMDKNVFNFSQSPQCQAIYSKSPSHQMSGDVNHIVSCSEVVYHESQKHYQNGKLVSSSEYTSRQETYRTSGIIGKYHLSPYYAKVAPNRTTAAKPKKCLTSLMVPAKCATTAKKTVNTLAPYKPTSVLVITTPTRRTVNTSHSAAAKSSDKSVAASRKSLGTVQLPHSPIPANPISPRVERVLKETGLKKYIPLFEIEEIDYEVFKQLTEKDLVEIGVKSEIDRDVILSAVRYWSHFY